MREQRYRYVHTIKNGDVFASVRFDDSLATVLAADTSTPVGVQALWRQLVDLLGRDRITERGAMLARLQELRRHVPKEVRAASARALAAGWPGVDLMAMFAGDDPDVALPLFRSASLPSAAWLDLLPQLSPTLRGVLRHRRDLPQDVRRGLDSFGSTDFVLDHHPGSEDWAAGPIAIEAAGFAIADLVARLDAFNGDGAMPSGAETDADTPSPDRFRFATDVAGTILWTDAATRATLIGATLDHAGPQGLLRFDAGAGDAVGSRAAFSNVGLEIGGTGPLAGDWRVAGRPRFDPATGAYAGLHGVACRQHPVPAASGASPSDQLRQLVHELRTPASAIVGFSELIGSELRGPIGPVYRDRAALIHRQGSALIAAIEDLDTAARIEGRALDLRPDRVDLTFQVQRVLAQLASLASERGAVLEADLRPVDAYADGRLAQRLVQRLLSTALTVAGPGERLQVQLDTIAGSAALTLTRPRALPAIADAGLMEIDGDLVDVDGAVLGTGFAMRLARDLAAELGGELTIADDRLTLRLPTIDPAEMRQAAVK